MFDFRYHVAALAAVFLALAVGVILGVAISGKVSDTQEAALRAERNRLNQALEAERERTAAAGRRGEAAEELLEKAYPALMEGRLEGKRFALLFLGGVNGDLRSAVERALLDADSGTPIRMTGLELPVEPEALAEVVAGQAELVAFAGDQGFGDLGRALGRELIKGGETPVWTALSSQLVGERSGTATLAVDGAIVVRSWTPSSSSDEPEEAERERATESLIDGILDGLDESGLPVVGVESAATAPEQSTIDLYRKRGISSVDDVDTPAGRLALALLLAGAEPGHYGVKDSASDGVAPRIEPLPAETVEE